MESIQYKIDVFEGPLDLLLHLISKHKLNINDIPIVVLVEQYIDYVKQMQESDMEVASEFIEMAARLVYIKTVSLLPVYDDAQQLKKELTGELIEYQQCKAMAKQLALQADGENYMCRKPIKIEKDHTYTRLHEGIELLKAYTTVLGKGKRKLPPPVEAFSQIVAQKVVSVRAGINSVYISLKRKSKKKLVDFFEDAQSRSEMVATFLALLELIKAKKVVIGSEDDGFKVEFGEDGEFNPEMEGIEFEY